MFNFQLRTHSAAELATHIIPEFYPLAILAQSDTDLPESPCVGEAATLNLKFSVEPILLNTTIVLQFDARELRRWFAVAIVPGQQALIHHIRYLCRDHTNDYGKLFDQLVTDFSHSHQ